MARDFNNKSIVCFDLIHYFFMLLTLFFLISYSKILGYLFNGGKMLLIIQPLTSFTMMDSMGGVNKK